MRPSSLTRLTAGAVLAVVLVAVGLAVAVALATAPADPMPHRAGERAPSAMQAAGVR